MKLLAVALGVALLVLIGGACAGAEPTSTPTPRPAATATPIPTPTATPRPAPTPTPTATLAPGVTPVATPTATPTATPRPAPTPTPTPAGIRRHGGELIVAEPVPPNTLDFSVGRGPDLIVSGQIYDPLESYDFRTFEFGTKWGLAESWEVRDAGKTWVFKLRKGVKFHGGETLTADDVKFSIDRANDPATKSPWRGNLATLDSVEVADPQTVVMRMKTPNPAVRAGWDYFFIAPKSWVQGKSAEFLSTNTNGTGSWKLKEFRYMEEVKLEAFKDQGMGWVPYFDTLRLIPAAEAFTRVALLQTNRAHLLHELPLKLVKSTKEAGLKVQVVPIGAGAMLWIAVHMEKDPDTGQPNPWRDVRVRQAANYGTNKQEIVDKLWEGTAKVLTSIVPNSTAVGYVPPAQLTNFSYNPDKAKQLLREAGYPNGFSTAFHPPVGLYALGEEVNLAVAQQLKAVGIDVKVEPIPYPVWTSKFAAHDLGPVAMTTWRPQIDAYDFLNFCCSLASGFAWYRDADFDKRFTAAAAVIEPQQRQEKLAGLVKEIWDKAVAIYLYEPPTIWASQPDIVWAPPLRDRGRFWDAYREQK